MLYAICGVFLLLMLIAIIWGIGVATITSVGALIWNIIKLLGIFLDWACSPALSKLKEYFKTEDITKLSNLSCVGYDGEAYKELLAKSERVPSLSLFSVYPEYDNKNDTDPTRYFRCDNNGKNKLNKKVYISKDKILDTNNLFKLHIKPSPNNP